MADLRYTSVSDYMRRIGSEQFSRLIFDDRTTADPSTEAPSDPFNEDGWRRAAWALKEAEQMAETYIGRQYEIPIDPAEDMPEDVIGYILDIAVYKLHRTNAPEGIEQKRNDAMEHLQMIANGARDLDLPGKEEFNAIGSGSRSDSTFHDL